MSGREQPAAKAQRSETEPAGTAKQRLATLLRELMLIPGLSGHEGRVRRRLASDLADLGIETRTDRFGNLIATIDGVATAPRVMLFAHMDQLGFVVRRIEDDGLLRLERVGGIPEKALPATAMLLCVGEGRDRPGVIGCKSNHLTPESEKYQVQPYSEVYLDAGFACGATARIYGVDVGTPAVYAPRFIPLGDDRIAGTSIDDRAGCAVIVEVARGLRALPRRPTVHLVFSVQEEYNVRGAMVAAQSLLPDIAIQLDTTLATDTPDLVQQGHVGLGKGPVMSMYNFHGRGTLNSTIPHPGLVCLFTQAAAAESIALQRLAVVGALTDGSYVQFVGQGVASVDLAFPTRYAHSPLEVSDLGDIEQLARLVLAGLARIAAGVSLDRDDYVS
jgi:putative aminopeptidase